MTLIPFTPKRFTDSELFTTELDGKKYLVKSYLGDDAELRRELERAKLKHWRACSFRVPDLIDGQEVSLSVPYLLIEFISGVNLSDALKDLSVSYEVKRGQLEQVYFENAKRHSLALENNDKLLVHTDPNTDNILLMDHTYVTIDFEHPSKDRLILEAIAHEVATFSRRALTDLGREHLEDIVGVVSQCYADKPEILEKVCQLTLGRNFQSYHRYKDGKKKAKKPGLVTRYDIADSVRARLVRSH
jgi:tRNA A-37 threonylcarbamoyl transferase component Bud32